MTYPRDPEPAVRPDEDEDLRRSENEGFGHDESDKPVASHEDDRPFDTRDENERFDAREDDDPFDTRTDAEKLEDASADSVTPADPDVRQDTDLHDSNLHDTDLRDDNLRDDDLRDDELRSGTDIPVAEPPVVPVVPADTHGPESADTGTEDAGLDDVKPENTKPHAATDDDRPLLEPSFAGEFQSRWQEVQAGFVDDPYETVQQAKQLAEEALEKLTSAITDRKGGLDERWQSDKDNTEELRQSLRAYRTLVERIVNL